MPGTLQARGACAQLHVDSMSLLYWTQNRNQNRKNHARKAEHGGCSLVKAVDPNAFTIYKPSGVLGVDGECLTNTNFVHQDSNVVYSGILEHRSVVTSPPLWYPPRLQIQSTRFCSNEAKVGSHQDTDRDPSPPTVDGCSRGAPDLTLSISVPPVTASSGRCVVRRRACLTITEMRDELATPPCPNRALSQGQRRSQKVFLGHAKVSFFVGSHWR